MVFDFFLDQDLGLTLDLLVLATTSVQSYHYLHIHIQDHCRCQQPLDLIVHHRIVSQLKSERCLFAFLFSHRIWRVKSET